MYNVLSGTLSLYTTYLPTYINSTSGREYLTENGFSNIDFLYENFSRPTLFLAYFGNFSLRMCSFDRVTTSSLKSDVIFEFIVPVFL